LQRHRGYIAGKIAFNQCDSGDPVGTCFAGGAAVAQMDNGSAFVMGKEQVCNMRLAGFLVAEVAKPMHQESAVASSSPCY